MCTLSIHKLNNGMNAERQRQVYGTPNVHTMWSKPEKYRGASDCKNQIMETRDRVYQRINEQTLPENQQ
jgi:hypothetical protein